MSADRERHRRAEQTHERAAASHAKAAAFYERGGSPREAAMERERGRKQLGDAQIERDRYAAELASEPSGPMSTASAEWTEASRRVREQAGQARRESARLREQSLTLTAAIEKLKAALRGGTGGGEARGPS